MGTHALIIQYNPAGEDHLERCGDCREEYEALLEALEHVQPLF